MRVILAALFVFGAMIGTIALQGAYAGDQASAWWTRLLAPAALLAALPLALVVFNRAGYRPHFRRKSLEQRIEELEAAGRIDRQRFRATRAFAVDELEDEGPHYYVELADGRVLYLNGQYLYDYEPIDDDPAVNQARSFPNTEFEVLRHKDAGYVLHIACHGAVLEPELMTAAFSRAEIRRGLPEDGQVFTDKPYEVLKRERSLASG